MIEVEKKFQPTQEQLEKLIEGAEFLGEKNNSDMYYDYLDYRLFKKNVRLRNRNGNFELKIGKGNGIAEEREDEEGIQEYFNTTESVESFVAQNLVLFMEYSSKRMKYRKGDFIIDIDEMNFGYDLVEIELLVANESEVSAAEAKILEFVHSCGIEEQKLDSKRMRYLKKMKPEVYKELYG